MPATTIEGQHELDRQRKERTEAREKAEEKTARNVGAYLEELEKYHIAGQGYMVAPKPPVAETPEGMAQETIPEYTPTTKNTRWPNRPARIGAEEALRLQAKGTEEEEAAQAKSAGGYYYPVVEAQDEDDEDEESGIDEEAKKKKKTTPPPPSKPPQQPPAGH